MKTSSQKRCCLLRHGASERLLIGRFRAFSMSLVGPEPPSTYKRQCRHSARLRVQRQRVHGLAIPPAATFRTWVYLIVVLMSECPGNSCTERMSASSALRAKHHTYARGSPQTLGIL